MWSQHNTRNVPFSDIRQEARGENKDVVDVATPESCGKFIAKIGAKHIRVWITSPLSIAAQDFDFIVGATAENESFTCSVRNVILVFDW